MFLWFVPGRRPTCSYTKDTVSSSLTALVTCQSKCPCPNSFYHQLGSSQTSVKSSSWNIAPFTRHTAVWNQSEQLITSVRQEFFLQNQCVSSRENIPGPLPVLQTTFHKPWSELVGNSTIQVKFCWPFCAFCGVHYLSSKISMFISTSSQLVALMCTAVIHYSSHSALNRFLNSKCFLKNVLSTNILTEVILILPPFSPTKKAKRWEHLEISAHITWTNEGSILSYCS